MAGEANARSKLTKTRLMILFSNAPIRQKRKRILLGFIAGLVIIAAATIPTTVLLTRKTKQTSTASSNSTSKILDV